MAAMGKRTQAALAGATAATRVAGPVLDAMIGALDPQVFSGGAAIFGPEAYRKKLLEKGIKLDADEMLLLRGHFARNDWEAVRNIGREAALRSQK